MSKAFTKETDGEDEDLPEVTAPLPAGTPLDRGPAACRRTPAAWRQPARQAGMCIYIYIYTQM